MAQQNAPALGLLLQDVILELQISNENVSGIETGVTMLVDSVSALSSSTNKTDDIDDDDKMLYVLKSIGLVNLSMLSTLNRLYGFFMKNDMIEAVWHRDLIKTEQHRDLIEAERYRDLIIDDDDKMLYVLKSIGLVNLSMLSTLNRLYGFFMKNDMIEAEQHRDLIDAIKDIGEEKTGSARLGGGKSSGLLGILARVAALTVGAFGGFFENIIQKIKGMKWFIKIIDFFTDIGKTFTRIKAFVAESKLYQKLEDVFSNIGNIFRRIAQFFGKIGSFLGKLFSPILNFIRRMPISQFIDDVVRLVGKVFGFIMKPLKFIMSLLGSVGGGRFLTTLFKIGKVIGRVFGKLLVPITVIMALVESVVGAFEGYKTGGVMGAIKGGLKGLLNSLIGWLIDIPKDLISWILDKFGFENASKWLDSWNFASLFDNLWMMFSNLWDQIISTASAVTDWWKSWSFDGVWQSIKDFFFGIWDGIIVWLEGVGGQLTSVLGNATDFIEDFYKSMLKEVLPDRSKHTSIFDPYYYVSGAIPDAVYDWANSTSSPSMGSNAIKPMPGTSGGALMSSGSAMNVTVNHFNSPTTNTNVTAVNNGPRGMAMNPSAGGSAYTR